MKMQALINIQHELKAPKNQKNNFGNFNYRSAEDILEAVKPLLAKNDAYLLLSDKPVQIGEWVFIEATATIKSGKEKELVTAYARHSEVKKGMDDSQVTGSTSSYARKYALNGLFAIDDTKDSDATNNSTSNVKKIAEASEHQKIMKHIAMSKDIETLQRVEKHIKTEAQEKAYILKTEELENV